MIKPDQVRAYGVPRAGLMEEADALERVIDGEIEKADRTGRWPALVALSSVSYLNDASVAADAVDEVIRRYEANGWVVTRLADKTGDAVLNIIQPGTPSV